VGLVALVLVAAVVVLRSPLLAVGSVDVAGAVYSDVADIDAIVDDVRGEPMATVDLDDVTRRFEALPWIRRADVRRVWPRRIVVDLVERRPVAAFYAPDGRYRVVDRDGHVIVALPGQPVELVAIGGDGPALEPGAQAPPPLAGAAAVAADMPAELAAHLRELQVAQDGTVTMALVSGGQVLLGPPTDVRAKLLAIMAVLVDLGDPAKVGVLDVRVPAKPSLQPKA
jgi:cell division protein FtsQ